MKQVEKSVKEKAGVIAYKYTKKYKNGKEPLVLLVTARKTKGSWVFPIGGVEKGESRKTAAKRECEEESGYCVEIGKKMTPIELSVDGKAIKAIRFTFYLATVVSQTEDWETDRTREWFPLSKATNRLPDTFHGAAQEAAQYLSEKKH